MNDLLRSGHVIRMRGGSVRMMHLACSGLRRPPRLPISPSSRSMHRETRGGWGKEDATVVVASSSVTSRKHFDARMGGRAERELRNEHSRLYHGSWPNVTYDTNPATSWPKFGDPSTAGRDVNSQSLVRLEPGYVQSSHHLDRNARGSIREGDQ